MPKRRKKQEPITNQPGSFESKAPVRSAERVSSDGDTASVSSATFRSGASGSDERGGKKRKRRSLRWNSLTYSARLTISFALVAAMTALVAIGVLSFVWQQYFQTYTEENMKTLAETTASNIERIYDETGTLDSPRVYAAISSAAETYGSIGIGVRDNTGGEGFLWDSTQKDAQDSSTDDNPLTGSLSLAPTSGNSQFAYANIEHDGVAVGSVNVWVLGSETLLRSADEEFRNNSYQAMVFATILAVVLASCIGFLVARTLVGSINRITQTARSIKEGNLSARTNLHGEDEIARLGETFDVMADSIERDRKLERQLTTDVAHELRTPLMAIQSTVEAMVDGVFEMDEERLATVSSEVQRLSRLVDAILKLSRLENRSTPLNKTVVDVGELVTSILATHEAFLVDSHLSLHRDIEPGVLVFGDADLIRQATANLISNAVRYTPEGGAVFVSVKRENGMAAIAVRDTGIGLTPEEAKMVFSRFWRADAGRLRERGGLGIGLSVVKEIVDQHGGWVQVEGRKGEGACFTIHIPLYVEEKQQEKAPAPWAQITGRGRSRRDQNKDQTKAQAKAQTKAQNKDQKKDQNKDQNKEQK